MLNKVVLNTVILNLVTEGESRKLQILQLCRLAMEHYSSLDFVTMQTDTARSFRQAFSIWIGLRGLLDIDYTHSELKARIEICLTIADTPFENARGCLHGGALHGGVLRGGVLHGDVFKGLLPPLLDTCNEIIKTPFGQGL